MLCCMNHVDEHAYTQLHLFSSKVEVSIFSSYFELILFHWPLMVLLPRFHSLIHTYITIFVYLLHLELYDFFFSLEFYWMGLSPTKAKAQSLQTKGQQNWPKIKTQHTGRNVNYHMGQSPNKENPLRKKRHVHTTRPIAQRSMNTRQNAYHLLPPEPEKVTTELRRRRNQSDRNRSTRAVYTRLEPRRQLSRSAKQE